MNILPESLPKIDFDSYKGKINVPGMVEDVYDFNPVELARGALKSGNLGSRDCKEMTLPVGSKIYDKKNENKTRCSEVFHQYKTDEKYISRE